MKFQGKEYPFTVQGLNVAAVGFAKINAVGDVYNLTTAADLAGKYVAVSAGLSLAKGVAGLSMRNDKGRGHQPEVGPAGGAAEPGRGRLQHYHEIAPAAMEDQPSL